MRGLGQSSGFTMELLNTGGLSREAFRAARDKLLAAARGDPLLNSVRSNTLDDTPTLQVDIDQEKVGALGLSQARCGLPRCRRPGAATTSTTSSTAAA